MENNAYEDADFGHPNTSSPPYEQVLAEMGTTQSTFYPPPDYDGVRTVVQPESALEMPAMISSPKKVMVSFPQTTNNYDTIEEPPPEYNPTLHAPQISVPSEPKILPQPVGCPLPGPTMMLPAQQTCNSTLPGTVIFPPGQQMVMVNVPPVTDTETHYYSDYLCWSIFNLLFCCFIFGIVALVFSIQTQSARRYRDWQLAKKKSRTALSFNVTSTVLGTAFIVAAVVLYYKWSSYSSYSSSYSYSYYG